MMKPNGATIAVCAAAVLVGANFFVASALSSDDDESPDENSVTVETPAAAVSLDAPAYGTAERIISEKLPKGWKRKSAVEPGVVDVLELACGSDEKDTALLAYHRAVKVNGQPMVAAVEVWPPGYGAKAIAEYQERASGCYATNLSTWSRGVTVVDYPAVLAGIQSGENGTKTLRWSVGDLTLSLTGDMSTEATAAAKAWTGSANEIIASVCRNLNPTPSDANRSPWREPDRYEGLITKTTVEVPEPRIPVSEPTRRKGLENLRTAERPEKPQGVPIWPASLPREVIKPQQPVRPDEPKLRKDVPYQIPDLEGPGCGWAFTAAPTPEFSEADSQAEKEAGVVKAREVLDNRARKWAADEADWREGIVQYYGAAVEYKKYSKTVSKVASAWDEIREAWAEYNSKRSQWLASVQRREAWKQAVAEAQKVWPANQCPLGTVRPVAPPEGSGLPTPEPLTCLLDLPEALMQPDPGTLPEPTPPPDPRPDPTRRD